MRRRCGITLFSGTAWHPVAAERRRRRLPKSWAPPSAFGGLDQFKQKFKQAAVDRFGSGYAWLVRDKGRLDVISTANAEPPFIDGRDVLLACDVWEHACYLDYQNRRPDYVDTFLAHLVNWNYVAQRMREPTTALREFS